MNQRGRVGHKIKKREKKGLDTKSKREEGGERSEGLDTKSKREERGVRGWTLNQRGKGEEGGVGH